MKPTKMTLKTQYKTAAAMYALGGTLIVWSEAKHQNGTYVFLPKGRQNLKKAGAAVYTFGSVLHTLGNVRVVIRAVSWVAKKVL